MKHVPIKLFKVQRFIRRLLAVGSIMSGLREFGSKVRRVDPTGQEVDTGRRKLRDEGFHNVVPSGTIAATKPTTMEMINYVDTCEISSSHSGEYDVQSCLLGYTAV
jgi:hypothetical protein